MVGRGGKRQGSGRKRLPRNQKRSEMIITRFTPPQLEQIRRKAEELELTAREYVELAALLYSGQ